MSTDAPIAAVAVSLLAVGCVSASPRMDLARVEQLARTPLPGPALRAGDDSAAAEEVRDLLAKPLTPDSAVRIAILNNPGLRAAMSDIAAARGRARQDGALPNPSFQFDLRRPVSREKDFLVEYDITRALLSPLRSAPGEAEVEAEQLRAATFAVDLGYRVRAAFFEHQAAQQRIAIANRTLDALAAGRDAARALLRAGNVRELDVVVQEAAYEGARASAAEIDLEVLERRETLHRLLGLHGGATAWSASPELPGPEEPSVAEDAEAQAVKASLELAELKLRLDAIARRTRLARAEGWIPDVKIDGHVEQDEGRWVILPNGMDGVGGLTQRSIPPGETYVYEFTFRHAGTFMYHPHFDEMTQIALGMMGMIVVHPRRARGPRVHRDFALMTHEWRIDAGARRADPTEMNDFNVLTFNSKAFPGTDPLLVGRGERVRIRLGNLSPLDHHPIHLHGIHFHVTGTDGGEVSESARLPETTVIVPVGAVRVIEFVPTEPGDWAMHCHMTHHMMNQMGHARPQFVATDARALDRRMSRIVPGYMTMTSMAGMGEHDMPVPENSIPMRGAMGPFSYIDMGGMFTVLKVRERPTPRDRDGWYSHPPGTVAGPAAPRRMKADGIDV